MISVLKKVWGMLTPGERRVVLVLLAMMLVSTFLELLGLGLVMPVVALLAKPELVEQNKYLKMVYDFVSPASPQSFLVLLCVALIVLYIVKNAFLALQSYWQSVFIMRKGAELADGLFDGYVHAPYEFHLSSNAGELMGKIAMADVLSLNFLMPLMIILTESLVIVFVFAMLLFLSPWVTLGLVAVISLLTAAVYFPLRGYNSKLGEAYRDEQLAMNKYALQGLKAVKESKIRCAEDFFSAEYARHRDANNIVSAKMTFMGNLPRFLVEGLLVSLGIGVLLVLVLSGMSTGSIVLTLSLFAASAIRVMPSMTRIQYNLTRIKQFSHMLDTVFEDISGIKPEITSAGDSEIVFNREIRLDSVAFQYSGAEKPIIEDFTLDISKNSSVAFVGPTGCGKTTLADLVTGLLKPTSGKVLVDGADIAGNLRSWRRKIGYVPQFIFLLDDTVRANVAFGVPESEFDDARVVECLKLAQIYDFVSELSNGIEHVVGENGIQLSGGQRQRIGIARALYNDPEVLILDEATSALDNETEQAFIDALRTLKGKLTMIMIAHRMTTVENCDDVVRLDGAGLKRNPTDF